MSSWNVPLLTNLIRNDVPGIYTLLHAAASLQPEGTEEDLHTDLVKGFKRLADSDVTDSTVAKKVRLEVYNGSSWGSVGKLMHDVDMLDGYHASKTSSAENIIPVYQANGKIAGGASGEANTAAKLTTGRQIDIGGIATADEQVFDGSKNITIPINTITVNNEADDALNGIVTKEHGGTGNDKGYATDIQMTDASAGTILVGNYGQIGESKRIDNTNLKSIIVPGNYVSKTVTTDNGFPFTDSTMTAYINVSKSGNSIIQRINMGGNSLWVNTSDNGGSSWNGLKPIGGAKQGNLVIYVSKSGSAQNSGFDPSSPILSIEHAIQICTDFARGYSNATCKLCVGEGDWGSFQFTNINFALEIYPYDGLAATEFTNSLPVFHLIDSRMGSHVTLSGVVVDLAQSTYHSHLILRDYCRVGAISSSVNSAVCVHESCKLGFFSQSTFTTAAFYCVETSKILIRYGASITIEENISCSSFVYVSSGGELLINGPNAVTITQTGTVTGKKFTINPSSYLSSGITSFDWASYLPGTLDGVFAVNAIINGIPYGGNDPDTYLCADRTWKKVTTLPVLSVSGNTTLSGNCTISGTLTVDGKTLLDRTYPVGSIYMSVNSTSPATLFGGTWEAIAGGRVLMGANSTYTLGSTGGEYTHTLSTAEMPSHNHSGSSADAGGHSHTLGSMNAWGRVQAHANASIAQNEASGVFSNPGLGGKNIDTGGGNSVGGLDFNLNRNFAGASSTVGNHSHTITIGNNGSGSAHNNLQPYLVVNMWKRTA